MHARSDSVAGPPWVIVAGGFHDRGAMDRANTALARYLLGRGRTVHLVGHDIDPEFDDAPAAVVHRVARPAGIDAAGEIVLDWAGRRVAEAARAADPAARVLVNGGNCLTYAINWCHAVHAAWPCADEHASPLFRLRNRLLRARARRREHAALRRAPLVIANSRGTAATLTRRIGLEPSRVHVVYLGTDASWGIPAAGERQAARRWLGVPADRPLVAFVGTLGHDRNKGFDRLFDAWEALTRGGDWDAALTVAGGGAALGSWRTRAQASGADGISFLGQSSRVRELLAAADLLVSPVRYEAYGLNVHEALCRNVPVLVSEGAGIVERFDPGLQQFVLPSDASLSVIAERLRAWRRDLAGWRARCGGIGCVLRNRTWTEMAAEIVSLAELELIA